MELAKIAVCALLVVIMGLLVFFLLKERKERRREAFADRIRVLIFLLKNESFQEWGHSVSYRFWSIRIDDFLKEKRSRYTCEDYVAFCVLSEKEWKGCKKNDFPGDQSVEKFLQGLLGEVRRYSELSAKVYLEKFSKVEGFSAPYDVFMKIEGEKCIFRYFDHLNYCTCAEVEVEMGSIDEALENSGKDEDVYLFNMNLFALFRDSNVVMKFPTPAGWLPATFSREDFERVYAEAQKS